MNRRIGRRSGTCRWGSQRGFALGLIALFVLLLGGPALPCLAADESKQAIRLEVDATELPRQIVRSRLLIPCSPGPLTLVYPKWIPGTHGPYGPMSRVGGLKLRAAGQALPWKRDSIELFAFHCDVPAGATTLEAELIYVVPQHAEPLEVSLGVAASTRLAFLNWNALVLYPQGTPADQLRYAATLRLPAGWQAITALPREPARDAVTFQPVSLTQLIDSPVLGGLHVRSLPLPVAGTPHFLDVAAEKPEDLELNAEFITGMTRLAAESGALFGVRHYRSFHYLLALSDQIPSFGLEHHECSVNSASPSALHGDPQSKYWLTFLMPHEFTHSWDGKYRRPAGLATPDYHTPQAMDLLWVYEGLTQYLGFLLDVRSGLWTPEQFREELAVSAAQLDRPLGRTWRSVLDTAIMAPWHGGPAGRSWRGGSDYYYEGALIWLEADVFIRRQSGGRKSLDDFCRQFFGGPEGSVAVKPYQFADIVAALDATASRDWVGFLRERLQSTTPQAPLGGIEGSGWKLVLNATEPVTHKERHGVDLSYSLGLMLAADGTITDVLLESPAWDKGLRVGMRVAGVQGRKWSPAMVRAALQAGKSDPAPLAFLIEDGDMLSTVSFDYHGGEKYPNLERIPGREDLLSAIARPLVKEPGKGKEQ